MRSLLDSAAHVGDPATLRARLSVDGYLYLPGLLAAPLVAQAGAAVLAALAEGGWVDAQGRALRADLPVNAREAVADPAYRRAAGAAEVNRIPYLAPLRGLVRTLLDPDAFSYPVKVLRAIRPEGATPPRGRYVHQDYIGTGVNDMLTTWVPLMAIPQRLGGLAVLPGSHLGAPHPLRVLRPDLATAEGWAAADFAVGDVLLFHCLTSHAALPNRSELLRLSQDCRWQSGGQSAPARLVYGPKRQGQGELFSRLFGHRPWWEPIPASVPIAAAAAAPGGPPWSRFFPVDPRWAARAALGGGRTEIR